MCYVYILRCADQSFYVGLAEKLAALQASPTMVKRKVWQRAILQADSKTTVIESAYREQMSWIFQVG